ncbi:MAG: EAL domain-containing protein [Halofilum sp. (in: g-proteobacteria)]|nr:EAL domain-containing protein [Halofilum sp. (in: g-proteobacteria)]
MESIPEVDAGEARVVVVSEHADDRRVIERLLEESRFPGRCMHLRDLTHLRNSQLRSRTDLLLYRIAAADAQERELADLLATLETPPPLLLLVNGIEPEHFVRAGRMAAADVVDLDVPAQLDFALRREFKHLRLRQQYLKVRQRLDEEQVIDDSQFTEPESGDHLSELVGIVDDALRNDRMELLFQPILAAEDDGYESHEIFLRIRSGDGYLMPDEFLPTARRYGLMPAIDRWVIREAMRHARHYLDHARAANGPPLRFFVNLSAHSLVDPVVIDEIVQTVADAELPPGSFVIEVDRNTILSRLQRTKSLNRNIKRMRLQFAMDHYEVSDISMNYLQHLELDYIKLNRSLVRNIHRAPERFAQVDAIVARAHAAGIRVIASQIERAGELAVMYDHGVDCFQGYVIAEPSPQPVHGIVLDEVVA